MDSASYYAKDADCRLCRDFLPGRELPELGSCRRFPAIGPLDTAAAPLCRCLKFRPTRPTCATCVHFAASTAEPAAGSCRHPEPIGPRGPDGWPRTDVENWCAGFEQAMGDR